jgi:hypothetical protein
MQNEKKTNPDPISGASGAHPVGTGVGAAAGAAGAAIGTVGGPIGTAVGAVVGAVAGGLAGKGVAEAINPTAEEAYWRSTYKTRPYVEPRIDFEQYGPAYRFGWEARGRYGRQEFEEIEPALSRDWEHARGESSLDWPHAKQAVRDAWERAGRANRPGEPPAKSTQ